MQDAPAISGLEPIDRLRGIERAMRDRGVERAAIFEWFARPIGADFIDVMVDITPGRRFTLFDLVGLEAMMTDVVGREIHLTTWSSVPAEDRPGVLTASVPVFGAWSD